MVIQTLKTVISIFEPVRPELKELRELEGADEIRIERNELIHADHVRHLHVVPDNLRSVS